MLRSRSLLSMRRLMSTAAAKPIDKLLVANRGEIACRIMRTANSLGMKTVAIYSEPDWAAPHVRMADEAICVGSAASADSYLRIDRIIEAVKVTGAQAVHPGYGFLSENKDFSAAVEEAGASFCGPGAYAIEAMGDKITSKKLAQEAGVDTIPGFNGILSGPDEAVKVANEVGYPVMLKASAGGGGKGMRIAYNDAETRSGFELSRAEAVSSFGDDRIFIERYVEEPRHIEIQLIADSHGNVVYLPPRECSIQRRNQKVVEEAPAPNLRPEVVKSMGEQAVGLAKAVKYRSAGTVEYLVDKNQNHYFLEMNTRLQVEHPVTEMVTGLDLVDIMLKVAGGAELPIKQEQVTAHGWAFESRVYAEDPLKGFLPSTGHLSMYRVPETAPCAAAAALALKHEGASAGVPPDEMFKGTYGLENAKRSAAHGGTVRCDTGVFEGGEISIHYDPMISKLITHAATREEARLLMIQSLDRYSVKGVNHNINFLRTIMANKVFASGKLTTAFIPQQFPDGYDGHVLSDDNRRDLLACAAALSFTSSARDISPEVSHSATEPPPRDLSMLVETMGHVKAEGEVEHALSVALASAPHATSVTPNSALPLAVPPGSTLAVGGEGWERTIELVSTGLGYGRILEARFEGERPMAVQVLEQNALGWTVSAFGTKYSVRVLSPRQAELMQHMKPPPKSALDDALLSPMPGKLVKLCVAVGDEVVVGQELCVVEAMKMQNVLYAQRDGTVESVLAAPGDILASEAPIIAFEMGD